MKPITICVAAVVAVAAGWGCGQSDEDQVRQTLQRFGQAVAAKDAERLCRDLLAKELLNRLAQAGVPCDVALSRGLAGASQPTLRVLKVDVRSDRLAYAVVRTDAANQQPSTDTFRVVKERGRWRVGSLTGSEPNAPAAPGGP
ncbi:MAG TPA: hypothetical protein VHI73_05185 [Solirubrobacteraceae bacterium]|nr:hypothetical protein [Solirubrobacteraceae bacterium]